MSSDDNIIPMRRGTHPGPGQPSDALVRFLEDALARARAGEVIGMVGAMTRSDESSRYHVIGYVNGFATVGAMQCAHQMLTKFAVEGE